MIPGSNKFHIAVQYYDWNSYGYAGLLQSNPHALWTAFQDKLRSG